MNLEAINMFWPYCTFIILLFITGLYYVLLTYNLIRALIGIELLMKAVTLLIVVAGYLSGRTALAQVLVITFIVIEVIIVVVASGIIIGLHKHNHDLDIRKIRNLKG